MRLYRSMLALLLGLWSLAPLATERVIYYHNDALGSPIFATNQRGEVVWRRSYTPYGQEIIREAPNEPGYTGKIEEIDLGISDFGARWYDPRIGRFLAIDPVGFSPNNPQSFNRYAYGNNNPYRFIDPDGRDCVSADGTTRCTPMGDKGRGLPTISFPTPMGFPNKIESSNPAHHEYRYNSPHHKSDRYVQQSIANDPTPGIDNPATPTGTPNNATPDSGLRSFFGLFGDSPVRSYTATDQKGDTWTINVTEPGHLLAPGYVLRGSLDGHAITYGEGLAIPQAFGTASDLGINDVWIDHNQDNIDDAR